VASINQPDPYNMILQLNVLIARVGALNVTDVAGGADMIGPEGGGRSTVSPPCWSWCAWQGRNTSPLFTST
jgi:hypothetical protein